MGWLVQERRTQLFSATMTSKVQKLQRACLHDPAKVEVDQKYKTVSTLRQQYLFIPAKHKVRRSPVYCNMHCKQSAAGTVRWLLNRTLVGLD